LEVLEKDWLDILKEQFEHPAIVLWRAVELRHIDSALREYKLDAPILDLGCAEGKIADVLFKSDELIGLDNSWELLSQNRKTNIYKALILADACRLPYKNGVFGSVFSNCVIEHIPNLDMVLSEVSRVLKAKGLFLFTVPSHKFADFLFFAVIFDNLGLRSIASWYKIKRNKMLSHFHCYDHNRWRDILKSKGLDLIDYQYYMNKKTTAIWDFFAGGVFLLRKLKLKLDKNLFITRILKASYASNLADNGIGGGLLIVAQKQG